MQIGRWGTIAWLFCLPAASRASTCASAYQAAVEHYSAFVSSSAQKQALERWEDLARQFQAVAEKFPSCHKADDALFTAGKLRLESYQFLHQPDELRSAAATFQALIQKYPASFLADDAQFFRGRCYELLGDPAQARREYQLTIKNFRRGDMVREARDRLAKLPTSSTPNKVSPVGATGRSPLPASPAKPAPIPPPSPAPAPATPTVSAATTASAPLGARVTSLAQPAPAQMLSIRYWSSKDYTRVVLDFDREVAYEPPHLLKPDPALGAPPRLYLDFPGTALSQEFKQKTPLVAGFYDLPIGDGLLKKARAGQTQASASRVVLDLESVTSFRCFPLPGEEGRYRVVIDIVGQKASPAAPALGAQAPGAQVPPPALAQPPAPAAAATVNEVKPEPTAQPSFGARVTSPARSKPAAQNYLIVIDAGHGGKDPGAIGPGRVQEKDITLAVAKKLKTKLEKENPNLKVVLTRGDDTFISLVERTARANLLNANLFVSIHCNASPNRQTTGIETYYLDNTTDRAALKLAARENFVTEDKMTQPDSVTNQILASLTTTTKVNGSVPLAGLIQESLVRELRRQNAGVNNLGVKKAPFWVLTGACMPCVLVETSFISNRKEEKRLASSSYQDQLARAVALGVRNYLRDYPELASLGAE